MRIRSWHLAVALAAVAAGLSGCGSSDFTNNSLVPPGFARGTRGAMDGFVFVPSRAVDSTAIPNATVKVYEVVGNGQPNKLLYTTQADANGFYHYEGAPLNKLLEVVAVDPFERPGRATRRVAGVGSFAVAGTRTRNLNPPSTLAAAIVGAKGNSEPLSDEQVSGLEAVSEERLSQPGAPDITADPAALAQLATEMADATYGTADVFVYSTPAVKATVIVNGVVVGTVQTKLSGAAASDNFVHLTKLAKGLVPVRIEAPGFLPEVFTVDVVAGRNVVAERTLTVVPPETKNRRPVIVDTRALPDRLPSVGGDVVLQAIVYDADGDEVTVKAEVRSPDGSKQTLELKPIGKYLFACSFVVPANTHAGNNTYSVGVTASDAEHTAKPAFAHFNFQVAGLR